MTEVNESIEEMIEESYLLGLTEGQIKDDIGRFVETCWRVIREHVTDRDVLNELAERLEEARTSALLEDRIAYAGGVGNVKTDGTSKTQQELMAEKAARNKRRLLRAIRDCDPRLMELIENERYRLAKIRSGEDTLPSAPPEKRRLTVRPRVLAMKACYIACTLILLLLIYWMVLEKLR